MNCAVMNGVTFYFSIKTCEEKSMPGGEIMVK